MSFTADFFINNRKKLKERVSGIIVVPGNGQLQRSGDTAYPFRQDSNFWYLTGVQEPDVIMVITTDEEFIILPKRTAIQDVFDGVYDIDEIQKISGVQQVVNHNDGWQQLRALVANQTVWMPTVEEQNLSHSIYVNNARSLVLAAMSKQAGKKNVKDISKQLTKLRMTKQKSEVDAIQKSVDITIDAFKEVMSEGWYKTLKNESDVATEFTYEFSKARAEHAYQPIVASGKNACTLHYISNNRPIHHDKPLLIDAGAECSMYAADITRVYAPDTFSAKQQALYTAVKGANLLAIDMVKPGVFLKDIELAVEQFFGEFLFAEKYITSKERKEIRKFYPHAVSHHLGLDVHDVADYEHALAAGMVITIEPGLYIPAEGVGIRLEDDVLVTHHGRKNLSADLPS